MGKGVCHICKKPLINPEAIGMHDDCARDYYKQESDKLDKEKPYVVNDGYGREVDRFDNYEEAERLIWALQKAEINIK